MFVSLGRLDPEWRWGMMLSLWKTGLVIGIFRQSTRIYLSRLFLLSWLMLLELWFIVRMSRLSCNLIFFKISSKIYVGIFDFNVLIHPADTYLNKRLVPEQILGELNSFPKTIGVLS